MNIDELIEYVDTNNISEDLEFTSTRNGVIRRTHAIRKDDSDYIVTDYDSFTEDVWTVEDLLDSFQARQISIG